MNPTYLHQLEKYFNAYAPEDVIEDMVKFRLYDDILLLAPSIFATGHIGGVELLPLVLSTFVPVAVVVRLRMEITHATRTKANLHDVRLIEVNKHDVGQSVADSLNEGRMVIYPIDAVEEKTANRIMFHVDYEFPDIPMYAGALLRGEEKYRLVADTCEPAGLWKRVQGYKGAYKEQVYGGE